MRTPHNSPTLTVKYDRKKQVLSIVARGVIAVAVIGVGAFALIVALIKHWL